MSAKGCLVRGAVGTALLLGAVGSAVAAEPATAKPDNFGGVQIPLPWIGSWFGKAEQLCATPATCQNVSLFMTPTLTSDGLFLGNDSLALGGPPFGPHTTAHGQWIATSPTAFVADYIFMLPGTAATTTAPATLTVLRFRWQAAATEFNTLQGYVNIFFGPNVPETYETLTGTQFPVIPAAADFALTPPLNFYTDPTTCSSGPPACPLIFKFTIQRVAP